MANLANYVNTNCKCLLQESQLYTEFENGRWKGILLGDSGYACKKWLLTPFRDNQLQNCHKRENFNREQKRARCIVERSFGQVKRRFACLHGEVRLSPAKTCKVIFASFCLHNLAKEFNMPELEQEQHPNNNPQPHAVIYRGNEQIGMRQAIVDQYFDY